MQNLSDTTVVILAGGMGRRLRSVVPDCPKVLAKIFKRPFLTFLLDQLVSAGANEVVLCTGYMGDKVYKRIGKEYRSLRLLYSKEDKPLGTGGALKHVIPYIDSEYFLVMNGDSYVNVDLNDFLHWHIAINSQVSIVLTRVHNVSRYGKVAFAQDGQILSFEEKGVKSGSAWINAGVYLLNNEMLKFLPKENSFSLEREYFPSLVGKGLYGYKTNGHFIDIGTPESFEEAEKLLSQLIN